MKETNDGAKKCVLFFLLLACYNVPYFFFLVLTVIFLDNHEGYEIYTEVISCS
jgi:hypothetical protein